MKVINVLLLLGPMASVFGQPKPAPIIDMHIHANHANFAGMVPMTICIFNEDFPATSSVKDWGDTLLAGIKNCKHTLISETTDDNVMNKTLALLRKRNIYGVTSGQLTEAWHKAEPKRVIPSFYLRLTVCENSSGKGGLKFWEKLLFNTGAWHQTTPFYPPIGH